MNKAERVLKMLTELCAKNEAADVAIKYSTHSGQFYLTLPCEIKEGICLRGICEHRDTIEAAAIAAVEAIKGKLLIFNAYRENRKEVFFYLPEEAHNGQST